MSKYIFQRRWITLAWSCQQQLPGQKSVDTPSSLHTSSSPFTDRVFSHVSIHASVPSYLHTFSVQRPGRRRGRLSHRIQRLSGREHCDLKHAWLGPRTLLLLLLLLSYIPAASLLQGLHLTDALQNTLHHREGPRYSPQPQGQINRSNWGCSWDWCLKHRAAPTNNTKDSSKFCVTDRAPTSPWSAARTGILLF